MCGITGWIDWEANLSTQGEVIERMAETMRRRGPDEKGTWLSETAVLGHRRLSVIDPANGQQPMVHTQDGKSVALVYNGELYNFQELRRELESRGHSFRTRCDTEVLLRAYLEWGKSCVERFDGIFAFGIWDERNQELFLARDRMGVKPLFWTQRKSSILFASELKALLAHPDVPAEVDEQGLMEVQLGSGGGFAATPGVTPYRGIHAVRPGRALSFARGRMSETTYWQFIARPHTDDADATVRRVRELLEASVKRQLVSDVPLACMLSGGLDSSTVTALAARDEHGWGKPLQSWCIDFVDAEKDFVSSVWVPERDAPFAATVAEYCKTEHHVVAGNAESMLAHLNESMRARDLPLGTQQDPSLLLLLKGLKKEATVALSGEGGDELFGGYPWHYGVFDGGPKQAPPPSGTDFPWVPRLLPMNAEVTARIRPKEYVAARYSDALKEVPSVSGETESEVKWRQGIYLGLTRWLPFLLDRKDRIAMRVSVEGRVPMLDQELVQYVWNVPREIQRIDGVEKGLLRRAIVGLLPDSILHRKKSAFPMFQQTKYLQSVKDTARAILDDASSPVHSLFDTAQVRQLCDDPQTDRNFLALRTTFTLELFIQWDAWIREYKVRFV